MKRDRIVYKKRGKKCRNLPKKKKNPRLKSNFLVDSLSSLGFALVSLPMASYKPWPQRDSTIFCSKIRHCFPNNYIPSSLILVLSWLPMYLPFCLLLVLSYISDPLCGDASFPMYFSECLWVANCQFVFICLYFAVVFEQYICYITLWEGWYFLSAPWNYNFIVFWFSL